MRASMGVAGMMKTIRRGRHIRIVGLETRKRWVGCWRLLRGGGKVEEGVEKEFCIHQDDSNRYCSAYTKKRTLRKATRSQPLTNR
jgi:hypothetical protein